MTTKIAMLLLLLTHSSKNSSISNHRHRLVFLQCQLYRDYPQTLPRYQEVYHHHHQQQQQQQQQHQQQHQLQHWPQHGPTAKFSTTTAASANLRARGGRQWRGWGFLSPLPRPLRLLVFVVCTRVLLVVVGLVVHVSGVGG